MIKLSIICLTYNHKDFIREALESFVMQKTDFEFEVIVHDDASTDGTAEIVREYQSKYPDIIHPIYQSSNQWNQGIGILKNFVYPQIRGQYVIFCEGDDYFIDENKLQNQVDFLDSHPDYNICFHPVLVKWEDGSQPDSIFPSPRFRFYKKVLEFKDLLKHNFIQTNSALLRWKIKDNEDNFPEGILPGDYFLSLFHAYSGKIGFLPEVMAVYRRHPNGIWYGANRSDEFFIHNGLQHIAFYHEISRLFGVDKSQDIQKNTTQTISTLLKHREFGKLQALAEHFPEYYQQAAANIGDGIYKHKYAKYKKISYGLAIIILIELLALLVYL